MGKTGLACQTKDLYLCTGKAARYGFPAGARLAPKPHTMAFILSPSLLSADFANLQAAIETLDRTSADWLHIDVMDGLFVPNITLGQPIVKAIRKHAKKPLDVHLMIQDPDRYILSFKEAGADILTVHEEACRHLNRTLCQIRDAGMKAGVAINPHTPACVLENVIEFADLVLVMSVNPGFGGQAFIENSYRKIRQIREMKEKYNPRLILEVDGGVSIENAPALLSSGADALVAGNAIFSAPDIPARIEAFKQIGI